MLDLRRGISDGPDPLAEKEATPPRPPSRTSRATTGSMQKRRSDPTARIARCSTSTSFPVGKHQARAITARDIESLQGSMKSTPFQANRVLTMLSKMFNLGIEWKMADSNPATGINHYYEDPRDAWLQLPQLRRLEAALSNMEDQIIADAIRLLLVTGRRVNEVLMQRGRSSISIAPSGRSQAITRSRRSRNASRCPPPR